MDMETPRGAIIETFKVNAKKFPAENKCNTEEDERKKK